MLYLVRIVCFFYVFLCVNNCILMLLVLYIYWFFKIILLCYILVLGKIVEIIDYLKRGCIGMWCVSFVCVICMCG